MPASAPSDLRLPLAVVAHDAGAANLMAGWVRDLPAEQVRLCVSGPAESLLTTALPRSPRLPLAAALEDAAFLLSGTSGPHSRLEHDARVLARTRGVPSAGVIDHWVNYPTRFVRDAEQVLPDQIWVADAQALALARKCFPSHPVHQLPNRYLDNLVAEVRERTEPRSPGTRILYVLEPMRSAWDRGDTPGEFQALDYFLTQLPRLDPVAPVQIRLRPHPSDQPGKYQAWLAARQDPRLAIEAGVSLPAAIAWADWVVGCESYALVAALAAGRKAVSTLPPWAPPCRLPHETLVKLRDLPA